MPQVKQPLLDNTTAADITLHSAGGALLPAAVTGALITLGSDPVGRQAFGAVELPVGVITAIIGAPYFRLLSPICGWLIPAMRAAAAHHRHPCPASAERPDDRAQKNI
ncbi:MAG: iron chelate uptake ABC transporter family permease subunit [Egibacteraceae bacterium]